NEPKVLNLLDMLKYYLKHQEEVITRRTKYDLNKAEERDHILQGLLIALDNIDEVISIIRASANTQEAKDSLIARFNLSDAQAQAIVDMRLRALTGLEREKLETEHEQLVKLIAELKAILADEKLLLGVIKTEITDIAAKYGDDRRSIIGPDDYDFVDEDMIPDENVVIACTNLGYIKRMTVDNFRAQNRGGVGITGIKPIDEDFTRDLLMTNTHGYIVFFTNMGRAYKLKVYEIPEASRTARGTAMVNLLQLNPGEKVNAIIPIDEFSDDKCLFMVTKKGIIKKTPLIEFANIRKNGLNAISLRDDDRLIEVKTTTHNDKVFIVTRKGMCIEFDEAEARPLGRTAMGVRGIDLNKDDDVIGMQLDHQGDSLLFVSENGIGKRTALEDFRLQHRGGKGLKCYKITEKTGELVGVKAVTDDHEIMMITNTGVIIQIRMNEVNQYSRITSGVKLMNIRDENVKVAKIAKVRTGLGLSEDFGDDEDIEDGSGEEEDTTEE
ncbi:MAG: DNA gyrase subunit A, partial [Lachnospiraceae bacterium]|nr:DNA gyrase subunit A [Lachnospiraceae bacterium]